MPKRFILLLLTCSFLGSGAFAIYRPFDVYRAGPRSVGQGATGTSNIDAISSLPHNPAYLAELTSTRFAFGTDAQVRITRITTNFSAKPQFIPIVAVGFPVLPNFGAGIMLYSPFQRHFDFTGENFIYYNLEPAFAWSFSRHLSLGLTAGAGLGLQGQRFPGWGFSYSLSLLYRHRLLDAGLLVRPGTKLSYSTFSSGATVKERLPDFIKAGVSKKLKFVTLSFEVEYTNWSGSSFVENGIEKAPQFAGNFLGRFNPHFGASFTLPQYPGLFFRTGLLTEDFYDFDGNNDRQVLLTIGLGGLAGHDIWGERLHIDFSLMSSFIPSLFAKENHQIEKVQVAFEFIY